MKCILAIVMILLLMVSGAPAETEIDLSGMSAEQLTALIEDAEKELDKEMQEDRIIENSIERIKDHWREHIYSEEWYSEICSRGYLEIAHTQIVYIRDEIDTEENLRETAGEYFNDIHCVVEFQLMSDYLGSGSYCFNAGIYNCVAVRKDGTMEVLKKSLLDTYRSRTYSTDFSGVVDSVKNLGSAYDAVYYLLEE